MTRPQQTTFVPHMIASALRRDPARPFLWHDGGTVSRQATEIQVGRYLAAFEQLGFKPGTRMAVLAGNLPEVLYMNIATLFAEAVYVALHAQGSVADFQYAIDQADIDVVFFDPDKFGGIVAELQAQGNETVKFLSFGASPAGPDFNALAEGLQPLALTPPDLTGDEVYRLNFSGGTTGNPKAIPLTHNMFRALTVIQLSEWEWPESVRLLLCAPLSHAGATLFVPTLVRGGTLYVLPKFDAALVLKSIEEHRITCTLLVPTMIYSLLDHADFDGTDLSSIETIFYGSAPMSVTRLQEGLRRLGPVFFQFYGQVEMPMTACVLRRGEHLTDDPARLSSCGRPVPWVQLALLDSEGNPVSDGEPGEICVRGDLVTPGYLNQPALNEETFRFGWLHSGDVGIRDSDGYIRIVDRVKDMIISGGFNVYSREVEDALEQHPAVAAAVVFGLPDAHWGEIVTAAVKLRPECAVEAAELMKHVRSLKGVVQTPKRVEFVTDFPLTQIGKPDKKALRQSVAALSAGKVVAR